MRNLKKILALVLAMMMTFSLMVTVNAADFGDAEEIEHTEAVEVLNAIKVLLGDDEGNFNPEATLTREQATTIIAKMLVGVNLADRYNAAVDPFADVAAGRWSAGYISFCVGRNIVVGVGDNKFDPAGTLTGYQFAAMLLRAVTGEEFAGGNWEMDVATAFYNAKDGFSAQLGDINLREPLSRQDAAQMAFNAMRYSPNGSTTRYAVKDASGATKSTWDDFFQAYLVADRNEGWYVEEVTTTTGSLINTVFGLTVGTTNDAFGRTTTTWTDGKDVKVVLESKPLLTYTAAVTKGKLVEDLDYTSVDDQVSLTVVTDGVAATAESVNRTNKDAIGGNGTLIEVYQNGEDAYKVVVINTYVHKLEKGDVKSEKKATSTADADPAHILLGTDNLRYNTTAFSVGQVVLYTKANNKVQNVAVADYVTGAITATGAGYFRIDNERYAASAKADPTVAQLAVLNEGAINTYYLDFYGNVIYAAQEAAADVAENYIYVLQTVAKGKKSDAGDLFNQGTTSAAAAQAQVLDLSTGEISIVDQAVVLAPDGEYYYANERGAKSDRKVVDQPITPVNTLYTYVTLEDGTYVLRAAQQPTEGLTIAKNNAQLKSGMYASSSTVLTLVQTTSDKSGKITSAEVTTYTGIANFPTYSGAVTANKVVYNATTGAVSRIIIVAAKQTQEAVNYAVYAGVGETDLNGTKHSFYIAGELVEYYSALTFKEGSVYNITVEDGEVTGSTPITAKVTGEVTIAESNYVVINNTVYYLASDCFTSDANDDYAEGTVSVGDNVSLYTSGTGANEVVSLIVINVVEE